MTTLGWGATLTHLLSVYGYWAVLVFVGLESSGIPVPGETMLLAAALYAGSTHHLSNVGVIAAAAAGAIGGDTPGFWVGRARRFGQRTDDRLEDDAARALPSPVVRLPPRRHQLKDSTTVPHQPPVTDDPRRPKRSRSRDRT